jgi:hypothetical protein
MTFQTRHYENKSTVYGSKIQCLVSIKIISVVPRAPSDFQPSKDFTDLLVWVLAVATTRISQPETLNSMSEGA